MWFFTTAVDWGLVKSLRAHLRTLVSHIRTTRPPTPAQTLECSGCLSCCLQMLAAGDIGKIKHKVFSEAVVPPSTLYVSRFFFRGFAAVAHSVHGLLCRFLNLPFSISNCETCLQALHAMFSYTILLTCTRCLFGNTLLLLAIS